MTVAPEGYNVNNVEAWIRSNIPSLSPPFKWTRLEGGHSNLTYKLKDSDGKESCSWHTRRTDDGNTNFILHDGTGGILIDPDSWKEVNLGEQLHNWESGRWRWTVWVLASGDPVYCLGRVETRTSEEKEDGIDETIPSSHLVVRGNKDIGMQVHLHRGTELSVISGLRSTTEAIIVPLIMLTFSAIPFLW